MGELVQLIPRERRHSVNSKYHALWEVEKAKHLVSEVDRAEERYDRALRILLSLIYSKDDVSIETALAAVAEATEAAIHWSNVCEEGQSA